MSHRSFHARTFLAAALLTGCAAPDWGPSLPPRRPLGAEHAVRPAPAAQAPVIEEPDGELTLRTALALALARSPELESFAWSVRQAEAERLQAGLPPNPELEAEMENFAGSGELRGTRALETTIALSQLIELGGKRARRLRLADHDAKLAGWDYEARRLQVVTTVAGRFVAVLAGQDGLALAREALKLARAALEAVGRQVEAGKVAPPERAKAAVEVASARVAVGRAERELAAARHRLAATWGGEAPRFARAAGELADVSAPPSAEALAPRLGQSPELARWETELAQRRAAIDLEKARAVPDVEIGVGYRQVRETPDNDSALVVTAGIGLPLFDRRQGAIRKARASLRKAEADRRAAAVAARAELEESCQALSAAYAEATSLRDEVLPAAERAHQAARESFDQGKGGYLDLLDAQRTLLEARQRHVEALASYHQALAVVEGLIGQSIHSPDPTGAQTKEKTDEPLK